MAEELTNIQEQTQTSKALIALTKKSGGNKILVESMQGYTSGYNVDGIYVTDGNHAVILSLTEMSLPFGGTSVDLTPSDELYNVASPSMSTFDGEWRTDFLIGFFNPTEDTALIEAKKFGWLPSGGEMALIASQKEAINTLLETVDGTQLSDGDYWTSQKFSNERIWSCKMEDGKFTLNNGNVSVLAVRPVKSANGYEKVTK